MKNKEPVQHNKPLIVDHFAGGGGASTGIALALGRGPDIAINHSQVAIDTHELNHPNARHYREDIWQVDPITATGGRAVELMWTSPSCTHHSRAKGAGELSEQLRALPWTAARWAAAVKPDVIVTENVSEMLTWGPLLPDGRPDPAKKGQTFRRWVARLEKLGYVVEYRTLDAADFGAPTHRERLFIVARRDGREIEWPVPTHGPGRANAWIPVLDVLDLANVGDHADTRKKPLSATTRGKIDQALEQLGEQVVDRRVALVQYNGATLGRRVSRPLGTLTCVERFGLAQRLSSGAIHYRMLTVPEMLSAQGFPSDYQLPRVKRDAVQLIGNSVSPLVAAAVVRAAVGRGDQVPNAAD